MKAWNEMTTLEQLACIHYDAFKDAYGYRPRHIDTSKWTVKDFETAISLCSVAIKESEDRRNAEEREALDRFNLGLDELRANGISRAAAIEALHEKHLTNGDAQFLCYCLGIPYGSI
jgi:hypothetical protein